MNREVLWGNMNRNSEMYQFIKVLVHLRTGAQLWSKPQVQRYADDHFYAFTRDNVLALFTNTDDNISRTITYHSFTEGTKLCNVLDTNDCIYVSGGKINVSLNGEPKVYLPSSKIVKIGQQDQNQKHHSQKVPSQDGGKLKYLK
jgi:alpha-amylase